MQLTLFSPVILLLLSIISPISPTCTPSNCPPLQGICSNNECICSRDFLTVNNAYIKNNGVFCNYETKSHFLAFLLELFLPFGVGHLYAENLTLATVKFCLFVVLVVCFVSILCTLQTNVNKMIVALSAILVITLLSLICFEIFDIIFYALNKYKDGNGVIMR